MFSGSSCTQTTLVRVRMRLDRRHKLRLGPRIHLLEEDDAGGRVLALLALDAQLMPDLAGADQQPLRVRNLGLWQDILEMRLSKVLDATRPHPDAAACSSA